MMPTMPSDPSLPSRAVALFRWLLVALARWLLRLRYDIRLRGLEEVLPRGRDGILFLPNHPALIDPVILLAELWGPFRPHSLADRDRISVPVIRTLAGWFRAIPMRDPVAHGHAAREDVARALGTCTAVLREGGNVVFYPTGRLQATRRETVGVNRGVETLLAGAPECRVVLVRIRGLWGSRFSLAGGERSLLRGFLTTGLDILKSLLLFAPRRVVTVDLLEAEAFPRQGSRRERTAYLEAWFNDGAPQPTYVPRTLWERGASRELPEPIQRVLGPTDISVPVDVRDRVLDQLERLSGLRGLQDDLELERDLGLDSLSRLELATWIEHEFQVVAPGPAQLETVGDLLRAAAGEPLDFPPTVVPPPRAWFSHRPLPALVPGGDTILAVYLAQAARDPHRPALADQATGMKTHAEIRLALCVLAPVLADLPGERVGLLMPASSGASILYLALLAAGKVPVMVNWTVGSRHLRTGLEGLGVRTVLSSKVVLGRLAARGTDLSALEDLLLTVEDLRRSIGLVAKVRGALRARFAWQGLLARPLPATAVILFTSGSEKEPKAVPLTHRNLLANVRDMQEVVIFRPGDRLLAFLPPFHSFGLTCNLLLPLLNGTPVVFHPNPTEGSALARMLEVYRASVVAGTPTFVGGMVRCASDAQLRTLRVVVTGGERCPQALTETLARRWPEMTVLEGYGITECSPVVSANREGRIAPGTLGWPLATLAVRVVEPATHDPVPVGTRGLLLVSGPSVFEGYLGDGDPFVTLGERRWFVTGDLVKQGADGSLAFEGRLKRFVKIGGEMVSLPAVEEVLQMAFPGEGVRLAVEAAEHDGRPDLVLFTVDGVGRDEANAALRGAGLSPLHFIRRVEHLPEIPVLGTGKTDYRQLKARLG